MPYAAINVEGGLFPAQLLDDIAAGAADLPATSALGGDGRRLTDDIQSAFSDARSYWDAFQRRLERSNESRTTLTRQDWMLKFLELIGFGSLPFQRAALEADGQNYNISHRAGDYDDAPPVHIVGIDQELDRREDTGRRSSPHALVQEYLNRSDALWGLVGNGLVLRLLRDTARLSKPTYLEFNLRGMMEGNQYSEFALLYRLIHSSHFPQPDSNAQDCGLEKYYQEGLDQGSRVREKLRDGVQECLTVLGTAFLEHPESEALRQKLSTGRLDTAGYYRQLLRLVYRFLFLMVAEERRLLFPEEAAVSPEQRVYRDYYSIGKLRDRAERYFRGDTHSDLWLGLKETFRLFRNSANAGKLGLTALDRELFGSSACQDLEEAHCRNEQLLDAVRHLSTFLDDGGDGRRRRRRQRGPAVRRRVNYAGLDVEELGSVYESLLDFHPEVSLETKTFELVSGSERKETGSYYTPPELVRELINSALVPVIEDRLEGLDSQEEKEAALLALKVCDPASGSGHFLLAAARRIARELAQVRTGEQEPVPSEYRLALRDVIRNCVYAVDKNPLAVDLCKVALWIEGHNAGLPLSFLDHHIRHGDSLVGVFNLEVLEQGIPHDAYKPVTGDDKTTARGYLQKNKREKAGQLPLGTALTDKPAKLAEEFGTLAELEERTPEDVQSKEGIYTSLRGEGTGWWDLNVACDLWTSAFFLPMLQENAALLERVPTTGTVRTYMAQPASASGPLVREAVEASTKHPFFHWPLEFPEVFENGGFDVVLGNPPWGQMQLDSRDFFAVLAPDVAKERNMSYRNRAISHLATTDPVLYGQFQAATHDMEALQKFIHVSGRFPTTSYGRLNSAPLFAEASRTLVSPSGSIGLIVPSGIATDSFNQYFFKGLVEQKSLVSLFEFENEGFFQGTGQGHMNRFCLLTMVGKDIDSATAKFMFRGSNIEDIKDPERVFTLLEEDFQLFNPNTRTCPIFRTRRDAELTRVIYQQVPVLVDESKGDEGNPWGFRGLLMFMMNTDSGLFRTQQQLESEGWWMEGNVFTRRDEEYLPLYEGKMVYQFQHRHGDYHDVPPGKSAHVLPETPLHRLADPSYLPLPRYWVPAAEVDQRLANVWGRQWILGWRDVTDARASARTVIASVVPRAGVGNKLPLMLIDESFVPLIAGLVANLSTFPYDYAARQKVGGITLNFFIYKQLPLLPPTTYEARCRWALDETLADWLEMRVLELVYTAWDLKPFALDLGYTGPPFCWDEERRFLLRCELDAAFFHLYGIERDDVDYIMETFPIVKRRDEQTHGDYRTKRGILEIYDEMTRAIESGQPYRARLDPPPGDPKVAHYPSAQLA